MSNQLHLIHYILQSKQTDDKIFSKNTNKRLLLRPVTFFSPRSLVEDSQAQNFLTDPSRDVVLDNILDVSFTSLDTRGTDGLNLATAGEWPGNKWEM